jgi:uncharacterized protein YggU (UPF0235/DUF167 family)
VSEPFAELKVRVTPRARREEIAGEREGRLLVRVGAPPLDGRGASPTPRESTSAAC